MTLLALTVWQPWASLIVMLAKPLEFRGHKAAGAYIGKRHVIHAGARRMQRAELNTLAYRVEFQNRSTGLDAAIALPLVSSFERVMELPHGAGVGTAVLGTPRDVTRLFHGDGDSDRTQHHMFAWPMLEVEWWDYPITVKGAQGFWRWPYQCDDDYLAAGIMPPRKREEGTTNATQKTDTTASDNGPDRPQVDGGHSQQHDQPGTGVDDHD